MDPIYTLDPKKTYKIPSHSCYACGAGGLRNAVGVTLHNGKIRAACERHADPKIKAKFGCKYCDEFVRDDHGLDFGEGPWDIAHKKCYEQDCAGIPFDKWK